MTLKKAHDDRSCNVVRKISNNLYRMSAILFLSKLSYINFKNILINNCYIIIWCKRLGKYRNKILINLNSRNLSCILAENLCHCSDSRPYLKHKIILCNARLAHNLLNHITVNQEILSESLLETEPVFLNNLKCIGRIV